MKRSLLALFTLLFWPVFANSPEWQGVETTFRPSWNYSFQPGEHLQFRVHYGLLNAATISMKVDDQKHVIKGSNHLKIIGKGTTNSGYDWFFKVRDVYESYIDEKTLLPIQYVRNVQEGGYKDIEHASFIQKEGKIYSSKGTINTPYRDFQDVLSSIYYLRNFDFSKLNKGDIIRLPFYLDKVVYETLIRYEGVEYIQTDLGRFRAIKLKPKVIVDRVFPKEDAMTIWASDDWNHIPLKVQSDLMIGSLKADITRASGLRYEMKAKVGK